MPAPQVWIAGAATGWATTRCAAGATRVIRLPTGQCIYDVRVVFANKEAIEKRRLNLCTITNLTVP